MDIITYLFIEDFILVSIYRNKRGYELIYKLPSESERLSRLARYIESLPDDKRYTSMGKDYIKFYIG